MPVTPWQYARLVCGDRYVELRLQRDLFGWVVTRTAGDLKRGSGEFKTIPCADYPEAIHQWNREVRARKRRGYVPVESTAATAVEPGS